MESCKYKWVLGCFEIKVADNRHLNATIVLPSTSIVQFWRGWKEQGGEMSSTTNEQVDQVLTSAYLFNYSIKPSILAQLLLLWHLLLHRLSSFLHLHLWFMQFPVQLHFGNPWPPPTLSALAAVLTGTTLSMSTSSGFKKEVRVGENWFLLYKEYRTPVLHPSLREEP